MNILNSIAVIVRFFLMYGYFVILGLAYSLLFKKKFSSSLAPALMLHVILVLLCGMFINKLSVGIYGGVILAIVVLLVRYFQIQKSNKNISIRTIAGNTWNEGLFLFTIFYILCVILNSHKKFWEWDHFMHWGLFLKEQLRLDRLYCTSPIFITHKDYVPAITIFETIFCKFMGRYVESDAFRAIQIFMFSMLMPIFEKLSSYVSVTFNGKARKDKLKLRLFELGQLLVIFLIPLIFNSTFNFLFYDSIYKDLVLGIVLFYCLYETYREYEDEIYRFFSLSIGMTILVLTKMTGMAFLPIVLVPLVFRTKNLIKKGYIFKYLYQITLTILVPISLWSCFNSFKSLYIEENGNIQSYSSMKLSDLYNVFINVENSPLKNVKEVRNIYIDALLHWDVLIHGSYVVVTVAIVAMLLIISNFIEDNQRTEKRKIRFYSIWVLFSSVYYAALMYFLYLTQFQEWEMLKLWCYHRYMNTFILSIVFFMIAIYFDSRLWKKYPKSYYYIIAVLVFDLSFFHVQAFDQVLPGNITHDAEKVGIYVQYANQIIAKTKPEDKVFMIYRAGGDSANFTKFRINYYCSPKMIQVESIGPKVDEEDSYSKDLSCGELFDLLKEYDCIYFCELDDAFISKYSNIFDNPQKVSNNEIYRISVEKSKVILQDID